MDRYVCIHGHFYQPPRENPWLEAIEVQDSAFPYRDWNDRITAECYSPNTAARILENGKVIEIVNNYAKISFNFGPTLLSWMRTQAYPVYEHILLADKESAEKFSGHGSAIAQVYNHMIMPLSNRKDKETQIIWGIEDFKFHFRRFPEGMWLAETAVDIESLELLAEHGIKFTILAPRQAARIRKSGTDDWENVGDAKIDPKRAYIANLPSGKSINLFFYDGPISQELAFGPLLQNGVNLADRMTSTFSQEKENELAHIATDGETYGHHQKHGDMALAYCLHYIESSLDSHLTVYGEYLEKNPPEWEVEIIENSSWSCIHGIERWRSNCGCNSGRPGWNQEWRAPLRQALDWLRDKMIPIYEKEAGVFTKDVWKLREEYIKIILDRSPENLQRVFASQGIENISDKDTVKLLKLLELQRHAMLMYTSCGWFFDEISGIETVQVILYAARVIQLARELNLGDFEAEFVEKLKAAKSNIPEIQNGAVAYERFVKPAIVDLYRVAAHFAVSSLFEHYSEQSGIFCYDVLMKDHELVEAGRVKMVVGRALMRSQVTYEEETISYAFLHLGDHNVNGGVRQTQSDEAFNNMRNELKEAFKRVNIAEIILLLDKHFGSHNYSLEHLFKDEGRKVFNILLGETLSNVEVLYRQIYEGHYAMMQAMRNTENPLPGALTTTVEYILNSDLKKVIEAEGPVDFDKYNNLLNEIKKWGVALDAPALKITASVRVNSLMDMLMQEPRNIEIIREGIISIKAFRSADIELDIWLAQNNFFTLYKKCYEGIKAKADKGDQEAKDWVDSFRALEEQLQLKVI